MSRPSRLVGCRISLRLSLSLSLRIIVSVVAAERVHRQRGDTFAVTIFARIHCERGVSPTIAFAARVRRQGVAPRRERVRVDDDRVPGTPLELGQKASCVSQL